MDLGIRFLHWKFHFFHPYHPQYSTPELPTLLIIFRGMLEHGGIEKQIIPVFVCEWFTTEINGGQISSMEISLLPFISRTILHAWASHSRDHLQRHVRAWGNRKTNHIGLYLWVVHHRNKWGSDFFIGNFTSSIHIIHNTPWLSFPLSRSSPEAC